jgi:hypothetical protein
MDVSAVEAIVAASREFTSWSLLLVGGSIATLLGTSYIRPTGKSMKYTYVLFPLGWGLLAMSFYYSNEISRRGIMAVISKDDQQLLREIVSKMTDAFHCQSNFFYVGLAVFGIWLVRYLFWWISKIPNQ